MSNDSIGTIVNKLSDCLASTYVLYLKTQGYHWNVVGPQFAALHPFLEGMYEDLADAADLLAERIRALGHPAPASLEQYLKLSHIKETTTALATDEMIQNLITDNESMARLLHDGIKVAQKGQDEGTADMLIQRIKQHEKNAWMLRSLLA